MTDFQAYSAVTVAAVPAWFYATRRIGPVLLAIRVLIYIRAAGMALQCGYSAARLEITSRWVWFVRQAGMDLL